MVDDKNSVQNAENSQKSCGEPAYHGELFDYNVIHGDEYYENYIASFTPNHKKRLFYRFIKRIFDFLFALILLLILIPFFVIVSIAIKIDSKDKVLFIQKRMGQHGKVFNCYKFRTMKVSAPHDMATSLLKNSREYQTRVGRFLRRFSLDELPQLWCILFGKMTFIGYRPLVLTEEKCNAMRDKLGVFILKPGLTGYAQIHGRDDLYYKNKAILDAEYVKRASLCLDAKIFFKTIPMVLKRQGNKDENRKGKTKNNSQDKP